MYNFRQAPFFIRKRYYFQTRKGAKEGSLACGKKRSRKRACSVVSSRRSPTGYAVPPPFPFCKQISGRGHWPVQISVD